MSKESLIQLSGNFGIDAIFGKLHIIKKKTEPTILQGISSYVMGGENIELSQTYTIIDMNPTLRSIPTYSVYGLNPIHPKELPDYDKIPIADTHNDEDLPLMKTVDVDTTKERPAKRFAEAIDEENTLAKQRRFVKEPTLIVDTNNQLELTVDENKMTPFQRFAPRIRNMNTEPIKDHITDISNILANPSGTFIKNMTRDRLMDKLLANAKVPVKTKIEYFKNDLGLMTDENMVKMRLIDLIVQNLSDENLASLSDAMLDEITDHINMAMDTIRTKFSKTADERNKEAEQAEEAKRKQEAQDAERKNEGIVQSNDVPQASDVFVSAGGSGN